MITSKGSAACCWSFAACSTTNALASAWCSVSFGSEREPSVLHAIVSQSVRRLLDGWVGGRALQVRAGAGSSSWGRAAACGVGVS
jgi:hypothetical protein